MNTLRNKLFICDAGYCSDNVCKKVLSQGGFFLIKLRGNCGFKVEAVRKPTTKGAVGGPVVPLEKGKYKKLVLKVPQENSEEPLSISPKKLMHSISPCLSRLMGKIFTGASPAEFHNEIERCCR